MTGTMQIKLPQVATKTFDSEETCDCTTSRLEAVEKNSVYDQTPSTTDSKWTKVHRNTTPKPIGTGTIITSQKSPKASVAFKDTSSEEDCWKTNRLRVTGSIR